VYSLSLLLYSIIHFRKAYRKERAKTHSLILTALLFDESGRVLVTPAGTLPGTLVDPVSAACMLGALVTWTAAAASADA